MKSAVHFTFSRGETMIRKTLVNVGVAALLGGMAVAAQAATVNINLGFANGSVGMTVGKTNEVLPGQPEVRANAGAFMGQKGGTNNQAPATKPFDDNKFITYCVQLTQDFFLNTTYQHSYVGGQSYFSSFVPALAAPGAVVVDRLENLFSSLGGNDLNSLKDAPGDAYGTRSAAIQLAVWESIYEGEASYGNVNGYTDSSGGTFGAKNTTAKVIALAESILDAAILFDQNNGKKTVSIGVLENLARQDFIVVEEGGGFQSGFVPEPTSLALTLGALGALGFATRRRHSAKV